MFGNIPDDPRMFMQRMEDELARQAIDQGCKRSYVTEVRDVSRRTTFNKEKRACAYDFPLDALDRGGRLGKPQRSNQRSAPNP
jgi:hypothetical protein